VRVLLSWLEDYIEFTGKPGELARVLTEVGLPVASIEALPGDRARSGDAILDVEITSNRGDCLSHLGIAREAAAATGQEYRPVVQPAEPRDPTLGVPLASTRVEVQVEAPDLCPAYCARVLTDLDNGQPTPAWIARRLAALGQRLVNPVVDVTNFVLLDRGQPLHAFDRAKLRGGRIVVRRSRAGESIDTIDGRTRKLPAGLLVIADAERPVAVAGVMGGRDTEVGPGTTEVVLESARFSPAAVRASAGALGLATEASARFSRRVDPAEMETSSRRAAALLVDAGMCRTALGEVLAGPAAADPARGAEIRLRVDRLARVLGTGVSVEEAAAVLRSLHVEVLSKDAKSLVARAPSHRGDLAIEEDLIEEVARVRGYGKIPARISLPVRPVAPRRDERACDAVRSALAAAGWQEALTLPFTAPGLPDDASPWTDRPAVRVENPVREEEPLLRRSLLGPLLRCLERNRSRGVEGVRLFEVGAAFLPAAGAARPEEKRLASGVAEGDYADARGAVEALAETLGLGGRLLPDGAPADAPVRPLDPARTACFRLDGTVVGWAGEVRAEDLAGLGVHREGLRAAAFEVDLDALLAVAVLDRPVHPVPVHPAAVRDLAVVLPLAVRWASVETAVREAAGPLLRSVALFDEYRGRGLPEGTRSLAFRLVLGADDRTLRGEEVDGAVAAAVAALEKGLGGKLRA
jgi:phenylalanyl-tRNA synthetase beta chain